jgi:hypothetical protein
MCWDRDLLLGECALVRAARATGAGIRKDKEWLQKGYSAQSTLNKSHVTKLLAIVLTMIENTPLPCFPCYPLPWHLRSAKPLYLMICISVRVPVPGEASKVCAVPAS